VISGKTKVCAIIGNPVEHSLSPIMHNAAFKEMGLNLVYVAFTVMAKELNNAISGVKSMDFKGLNVTMPHKNTVIKYLDDIDKAAKNIGAVNTILCENGRLIGYNTDGKGAMIALQENGVYLEDKKVILIGAGGAAKAIGYHAAQVAKEIVILNRTLQKAQNLAQLIRQNFKKEVKSIALSSPTVNHEVQKANVLINSTSIGMYPEVANSPIPMDFLHSDLDVMDIIYDPMETKLVKEAKSVGAKTISGIEMLIYQGAAAFEIWTNCSAPVKIMKKAVLNQLKASGGNL
jgi:shikimate dehydrogenase